MFHHFKTLWLRLKAPLPRTRFQRLYAACLSRIAQWWLQVKALPPGARFQSLYATYLGHDAEWFRTMLQFIALASASLGIALSLTREAEPPQISLAFALAFGLYATQTPALARILDMLELLLRAPFRQQMHATPAPLKRSARPAALVITERVVRLPPPAQNRAAIDP